MLFRALIVGVLGYLGLVFLLLISGKRTISKMNALTALSRVFEEVFQVRAPKLRAPR